MCDVVKWKSAPLLFVYHKAVVNAKNSYKISVWKTMKKEKGFGFIERKKKLSILKAHINSTRNWFKSSLNNHNKMNHSLHTRKKKWWTQDTILCKLHKTPYITSTKTNSTTTEKSHFVLIFYPRLYKKVRIVRASIKKKTWTYAWESLMVTHDDGQVSGSTL